MIKNYIKKILKEEFPDKYEKEWKEGRNLEDVLKEVEFLIKTRGKIPELLKIRDMLRLKLQK